MKFSKMNGTGNDYIFVYLDEIDKNPCDYAEFLSDRHYGIGGDGLVIIGKSLLYDFFMDIYNADGGRARMCGNAIRCVGKYVYDNGLTDKRVLKIETLSGVKELMLDVEDGKVVGVKVNMGTPLLFTPTYAPTLPYSYNEVYVDVGNRHAVMFVESLDDAEFEKARTISITYPDGINCELVKKVDRKLIELRVHERGSGETLACGTGATAAVYAGIARGILDNEVTVVLKGGRLEISYDGINMYMYGDTKLNYEGEIKLNYGENQY